MPECPECLMDLDGIIGVGARAEHLRACRRISEGLAIDRAAKATTAVDPELAAAVEEAMPRPQQPRPIRGARRPADD